MIADRMNLNAVRTEIQQERAQAEPHLTPPYKLNCEVVRQQVSVSASNLFRKRKKKKQ